MQPLLALVDCNNFYVSCERVFRPDLIGKPVAVLSNNDGCIVSRSQEVKDLGIKMAVPLFQVQHLVKQHNIQLFSSNYCLYADMSARVMAVLEEFAPSLEIYSIDEAFLDLSSVCRQDSVAYGHNIRKTVRRQTGIPVCVGMGPTKTLAKLANYAAKKWKKTGGVLDLSDPVRREKLMRIVPVREVWGIGARTAAKLNELGVHSVWDLACQPSRKIHAEFNVVVARTVQELNGVACLQLEEIAPDKQQIICSRSFSQKLTDFRQLAQALSEYCSRAAEKLRRQNSLCACISVSIRTSRFAAEQSYYQRTASIRLSVATQDSRVIIAAARRLLQEIFKAGYAYEKCGVQLGEIQAANAAGQLDVFGAAGQGWPEESQILMQTLDQINRRYPRGMVIAASGLEQNWKAKVGRISQAYTTNWRELVCVSCV